MRSLIPAACLLVLAVATPSPRQLDLDSIPSALITLYVPSQGSADERQLTFHLDVGEASSPCGFDTNVSINGQRLNRNDDGTGQGTLKADEDATVIADWNFTCIEWNGEPHEQFLSFSVSYIDDVPQEATGFVVRFQQTAPVWISDVEGSASITRIHNQPLLPPADDDLEYELIELDFLRGQLAELEEMILLKEARLAEVFGWRGKKGFHECDSIKCIFQAAYSHIHDAAKNFYSGWMDIPSTERHGKPKESHHRPPHWGRPHHGNHTHDNGTHPHPPFHHPPPHHGPPFHPPPFCKCPPPPPHHGPGKHHPPPHEKPPHKEPPKEGPPKGGDDGIVELGLQGTHHDSGFNYEAHDHEPESDENPSFPSPPHQNDDEKERPITPPGAHGDHPPPKHDSDDRHPPHRGGPSDDRPPPPPEDHRPKHGGHGPPHHPAGLKSFLSDPAFVPYRISACVVLIALLLVSIHARCARRRRGGNMSRLQRRRAARRSCRSSRCPGGSALFRRIMFWRRSSASSNTSPSFVDAEAETMLGRHDEERDTMNDTDSEDNMSTTMEQEIAQFRAAASVVGDMIAAEEGRVQARDQMRELVALQHQHRQRQHQEMEQMASGFVTIPLRGSGNAAARVPTDVRIHTAQLSPFTRFVGGAGPSSPSSDSGFVNSSSGIEMGMAMPPSPTAAFAEFMPNRADDTQLPEYDFADGLAASHVIADGMMYNHSRQGYTPGLGSPVGSAGSADAFGDAKPSASPEN